MDFKFIAIFEHVETQIPNGIKISFFEYLLWYLGFENMFFKSIEDRFSALGKRYEKCWSNDFFFEGCKKEQ